jgi:hypothetical protein
MPLGGCAVDERMHKKAPISTKEVGAGGHKETSFVGTEPAMRKSKTLAIAALPVAGAFVLLILADAIIPRDLLDLGE